VTALCVIPVRFQSTRFPGKPLADLLGKPLIQHVVERVKLASRVNEIIVATDDARIEDAVKSFEQPVTVVQTKADHESGTDRIAEVAAQRSEEVIVNVQGDEPLIDVKLIDALIALFEEDASLKMATAKVRITDPHEIESEHAVKVATDDQGYAVNFSRNPILGDKSLQYKHLGIYAYRRDFLIEYAGWPVASRERQERLEQLRALEHRVAIRVIETEKDSIGVDTPEDLERVRNLMTRKSET